MQLTHLDAFSADGELINGSCNYLDLFTNLYPKGKAQNTMTRPVKNYTTTTEALLAVLIYAILDLVSCVYFATTYYFFCLEDYFHLFVCDMAGQDRGGSSHG